MTARRHSLDDTVATARAVRDGTDAILSIDLICAWPGQTLDEWHADLDAALALGPDHISVYELTYHGGTELARRQREGLLQPLPEELRADMFHLTAAKLTAAGFEHYEISNFACRRPGAPALRSRHNENYWLLGDYLGLGSGAHSHRFPRRWQNPHDATGYERAITGGSLTRADITKPDPHLAAIENLQYALRLVEGVDMDWFAARYGVDVRDARADRWRALTDEGLLQHDGPRTRLAPEARLRLDSIIEYLL